MLGGKHNYQRQLGGKGDPSNRFFSGVKGLARTLDDPAVQFGISVLEPELAGGLALAKKTGLLKKVAGM